MMSEDFKWSTKMRNTEKSIFQLRLLFIPIFHKWCVFHFPSSIWQPF
jgi:hypothetical protein